MTRDEAKGRQKAKQTLKKLKSEVSELELKLNQLLDDYLDQVIESEMYRQKKNELFEQKLKLQEKIAKIQKDGSS